MEFHLSNRHAVFPLAFQPQVAHGAAVWIPGMDRGTTARPIGYILRDLPIEEAGTPEQKTGAGVIGPEPLAVPYQVSRLGPEGIPGVVPLLVPYLQSVFPVLKRGGERRLLSGRGRTVECVQTGPLVLRHL